VVIFVIYIDGIIIIGSEVEVIANVECELCYLSTSLCCFLQRH
jgi:hypothetical protein